MFGKKPKQQQGKQIVDVVPATETEVAVGASPAQQAPGRLPDPQQSIPLQSALEDQAMSPSIAETEEPVLNKPASMTGSGKVQKEKNTALLPIIVAVCFGLAILGFAYMAYNEDQKLNDAKATNTDLPIESQQTDASLNVEEVAKEILGIVDTLDFTESPGDSLSEDLFGY